MGFLFFGKRDDEEENILDEINSELDAIKVKMDKVVVPAIAAGELTAQEQEWWNNLKARFALSQKIESDLHLLKAENESHSTLFWIGLRRRLKLDIGETYKIDGDKVTKTRRAR
jgi:hypothetical protein